MADDAKVVVTDPTTGQVKKVKALSETDVTEMHSRIEQVLDDVHRGRPEKNAKAPVDEYELRQHQEAALAGRDKDKNGHWRQVMEFFGFSWVEPKQLDERVGPQRYIPSNLDGVHDRYGRAIPNTRLYWTRDHAVGQWRDVPDARNRPHPALRGMAFTMADLIGNYGKPEEFDKWAKAWIERWKKRRSGIRFRRR